MKGAGDRVIPPYVEQPGNPFTSLEEKSSRTERFNDNQRMAEKTKQSLGLNKPETPIIDLQVYQPPAPAKPPAPVNIKNFIPIGTSNYGTQVVPNLMYPDMVMNPYLSNMPASNLPYTHVANQPPILKNYTINIGGVNADHGQVNAIFEDIMPEKFNNNSFNTIMERVNITQYIRSIFIKQYDGEDVSLGGKADNSLLRYIKFLDLNPYNPNLLSDNPYKGLPDNMLIYRSCYPIRKNPMLNQVQCASRALGMNVRIYRLTNAEYDVMKTDKSYDDYDIWRELRYYEYIRDVIIKKGICPNFTIMYSYNISQNCDIDFEKVNGLKRNFSSNGRETRFNVRNNDGIQSGNSLDKPSGVAAGHRPMSGGSKKIYSLTGDNKVCPLTGGNITFASTLGIKPRENVGIMSTMNNSGNNRLVNTNGKVTLVKNENASSGKALIMLTEAPTTSIIAWASKEYKVMGNVRQMINTGYHSEEVWLSVIFQLIAGLYAMQCHGIVINEFSLVDNVYIKEVTTHGHIRKYWIYNIDGFNYYVPNHGFLVLIDSNYKDIVNPADKLSLNKRIGRSSSTRECTMVGGFGDNSDPTLLDADEDSYSEDSIKKIDGIIFKDSKEVDIDSLSISNFKRALNLNNFSNAFVNVGGSRPNGAKVNKILESVTSYSGTSISDFIFDNMKMFMNNRIGTLLYTDEISNIMEGTIIDFAKVGQILVCETDYKTYTFVLYSGPGQDGKYQIITRDNPSDISTLVTKYVTKDLLKLYSPHEQINQQIKDSNFTSDNLLETYVIRNNINSSIKDIERLEKTVESLANKMSSLNKSGLQQ